MSLTPKTSLSPLAQVFSGVVLQPPPVWLMRQAGRYLPEYRKLRATTPDFLEFCLTPEISVAAAMQPMTRFPGLDAAIVFSDILTIPHALGCPLAYPEGGPRLARLEGGAEVLALVKAYGGRMGDVTEERLGAVAEAVRLLRAVLPAEKEVIGFVGAPWTLACYLLQGSGVAGFPRAVAFLEREGDAMDALLGLLEEAAFELAKIQIIGGAGVLQIFDSWAGLLEGADFERACVQPIARLVARLRGDEATRGCGVAIHARGGGVDWARLSVAVAEVGGAVLAPGADVPLHTLVHTLEVAGAGEGAVRQVLQGNLDPLLLTERMEESELDTAFDALAVKMRGLPWVLNCGGGLVPETRIERVEHLLERARGLGVEAGAI